MQGSSACGSRSQPAIPSLLRLQEVQSLCRRLARQQASMAEELQELRRQAEQASQWRKAAATAAEVCSPSWCHSTHQMGLRCLEKE